MLRETLSPGEQARAARFHAERHRTRFIAAHGLMRRRLGSLLNESPAALQFAEGEHGKPRLEGEAASSGLAFNLSHSGSWALLGWSSRGEIGVDIELWRHLNDEAALVRRFFSPAENSAYDALPAAMRQQGFFECWTRKEAYVKAVGRGLGLPLDSFDVSFGDHRPARLLRPSAELGSAQQWSLVGVDVGSGASGAVVLEGETCHISQTADG